MLSSRSLSVFLAGSNREGGREGGREGKGGRGREE